jgi:small subunit ribosomal protein S21
VVYGTDHNVWRRTALFLRRFFSGDGFADVARTLKRREKKRRRNLEVKVFDNDVEKALKILKNKLSKSGLFKELKLRRAYEKPSVKKKRKAIEARRRLAKVQRRRVP